LWLKEFWHTGRHKKATRERDPGLRGEMKRGLSMPRRFLLCVLLLVCGWGGGAWAAAPEGQPDILAFLKEERIGDLRLGLTEEEVKARIPGKLKKGKERQWAATGEYVQKWAYPDCGVFLEMSSDDKGGAKRVMSITIRSPSLLRTTRGIRIGSTEQELMKAYGPYQDEEMSRRGRFVAGSIYGGVIFSVKAGQVTRIFLGAAAE